MPLMGEHWVNRELLKQPVDLLHPAVLQYINVGDRRVLVGVAYGFLQRPGDGMPSGFAGPTDRWHRHDMPELIRLLTRRQPWVVRSIVQKRLDQWAEFDGRTELAMLHVWLWSYNPDGMFANYNPALPYMRAGLPPEWSSAGDYSAARGIELTAPGGCDRMAVQIRRFFGKEPRGGHAWQEACGGAAEKVRAAGRRR
jgi:hypothetical protein